MKIQACKRRQGQQGLTYIESMLGVLLLAVCLVPAVQAINNNISRLVSLESSERSLPCLLATKERIFAEPFTKLLSAATSTHSAGKFSDPSSYSESPTPACPLQKNVYILRYNSTFANPFASTSNEMVYVRIEQADGLSVATLAIQQ